MVNDLNLTRPPALVERLVTVLRRHVQRLATGDKLPTVRALAEAHGVSVTVVREAVAALRSEGLLETRQGAGLFVARPAARWTFEARAASLSENLLAVFELRAGVEVVAASLAAARRTPAQLAMLGEELVRMASPQTRVAADVAFHRLVAEASGNPHYARLMPMVRDAMEGLVAEAVLNTELAQRVDVVVAEHRAVFTAIEAGKPAAAAAAMRTHLLASAERLGLDLGERLGQPRHD